MNGSRPNSVLITGASGGIGSALAEVYAGPGVRLFLHGRNQLRLSELAARCAARGAQVETRALDLRDRAALTIWVGEILSQAPIDLAIANAGVNTNVSRREQLGRRAGSSAAIRLVVWSCGLAVRGIVSAGVAAAKSPAGSRD